MPCANIEKTANSQVHLDARSDYRLLQMLVDIVKSMHSGLDKFCATITSSSILCVAVLQVPSSPRDFLNTFQFCLVGFAVFTTVVQFPCEGIVLALEP